jgi:hypothetical protein
MNLGKRYIQERRIEVSLCIYLTLLYALIQFNLYLFTYQLNSTRANYKVNTSIYIHTPRPLVRERTIPSRDTKHNLKRNTKYNSLYDEKELNANLLITIIIIIIIINPVELSTTQEAASCAATR